MISFPVLIGGNPVYIWVAFGVITLLGSKLVVIWPRLALLLGLLASLAMVTGCATTTTRYPDGREVTTTSYGGSAQCVQRTAGWTIAGGLAGAVITDTSKGAGRGAILGALFGSQRECQESLQGVGGGQRAERYTMEKVDRISTEECARQGRTVSGRQCLPAGSAPSGAASASSQIWDPVDSKCARGLTLEGSDGRAQKCMLASTFLQSSSRACVWKDMGAGTWRLMGEYNQPLRWNQSSSYSVDSLRGQGMHASGCFSIG